MMSGPTDMTRPRLLLAEDDPEVRPLLEMMLNRKDYEVHCAANGEEVLEMWRVGGYDLVLMDVQMPRINGFEACSTIRKMERGRDDHTPIIAVTAHSSKEYQERAFAAGIDVFVCKPLHFKELLDTIEELLKQSRGVTCATKPHATLMPATMK